MKIDISVVLFCFSADHILTKCLNSYLVQNYPVSRFEIIIVPISNRSESRKVIDSYFYSGHINIKIIHNIKNNIFNHVINIASGKIIFFTCDFVYADKSLLEHIYNAFTKTLPVTDFVVGKTLPVFEIKPKQLFSEQSKLLFGIQEKSSSLHILNKNDIAFFLNIAFRKNLVFNKIYFETTEQNLFLKYRFSEVHLFRKKIESKNKKIYYCPNMIVYYLIQKKDLSIFNIFLLSLKKGMFTALLNKQSTGKSLFHNIDVLLFSFLKVTYRILFILPFKFNKSNIEIIRINFYRMGHALTNLITF